MSRAHFLVTKTMSNAILNFILLRKTCFIQGQRTARIEQVTNRFIYCFVTFPIEPLFMTPRDKTAQLGPCRNKVAIKVFR